MKKWPNIDPLRPACWSCGAKDVEVRAAPAIGLYYFCKVCAPDLFGGKVKK